MPRGVQLQLFLPAGIVVAHQEVALDNIPLPSRPILCLMRRPTCSFDSTMFFGGRGTRALLSGTCTHDGGRGVVMSR